jgi:hypothetical protein
VTGAVDIPFVHPRPGLCWATLALIVLASGRIRSRRGHYLCFTRLFTKLRIHCILFYVSGHHDWVSQLSRCYTDPRSDRPFIASECDLGDIGNPFGNGSLDQMVDQGTTYVCISQGSGGTNTYHTIFSGASSFDCCYRSRYECTELPPFGQSMVAINADITMWRDRHISIEDPDEYHRGESYSGSQLMMLSGVWPRQKSPVTVHYVAMNLCLSHLESLTVDSAASGLQSVCCDNLTPFH